MRQTGAASERAAAYRQRLIARRQEILDGFSPPPDCSSKAEYFAEEDQAQLSHDEFVIVRKNGLDYLQLRLIEEALDRIDSGDYGICLNCERPIPAKRLDALPWARYCVPCQNHVGARQEDDMIDARPRLSPLWLLPLTLTVFELLGWYRGWPTGELRALVSVALVAGASIAIALRARPVAGTV
jgi:DnaK suppressor protein